MASEDSVCLWTRPGWLYYMCTASISTRRLAGSASPASSLAPRCGIRTAPPAPAGRCPPACLGPCPLETGAYGTCWAWWQCDPRLTSVRSCFLYKNCPPPFPTSSPRPPAFPHLPRRLVRRSVLSRLGALTSPPSPQSALLTPTISLNVTPSGKPWGGRRCRVKSLPLQRCLHPNPEKLHMLLTGCAKVADGLKAADQLTLK